MYDIFQRVNLWSGRNCRCTILIWQQFASRLLPVIRYYGNQGSRFHRDPCWGLLMMSAIWSSSSKHPKTDSSYNCCDTLINYPLNVCHSYVQNPKLYKDICWPFHYISTCPHGDQPGNNLYITAKSYRTYHIYVNNGTKVSCHTFMNISQKIKTFDANVLIALVVIYVYWGSADFITSA